MTDLTTVFEMKPIGFVRSPYRETGQVPKGCGATHTAEGILEILPDYEQGLMDIEGFSHLFVIWVFHRAEGCELVGRPPTDDRPHGVFATRSPYSRSKASSSPRTTSTVARVSG